MKEIIKKAREVSTESQNTASLIRQKSARIATIIKSVQVASVLIGIIGVSTNFQIVADLIGSQGVSITSVITAISLIGTALYYAVIGVNTPERYTDHGRYIGAYSEKIEEILNDSTLSKEVKTARLQELIRLATWNLSDAKDKWPWIEKCLS